MFEQDAAKRVGWIALGLALFTVASCGSDGASTVRNLPKKAPISPVAMAAQGNDEESGNEGEDAIKKFEYTAIVDPFEKVKIEIEETGPDDCGAICEIELTQLVVRGIIFDVNRPRALVEDDQGNGYILAKGDLIGTKHGTVIEINEQEMIVLEKYVTPEDYYVVKVPMKIREEE